MSDGNTAAVDYRAVLRDMVAQLLTERVPWHAFENTFNWYYHFFIPELKDGDESDFFDFVNELLTWTRDSTDGGGAWLRLAR